MLGSYIKVFPRKFKLFLEKLDKIRDEALSSFIKSYWPRKITPNRLTFLRIFVGLFLIAALFYFNDASQILIVPLFVAGVLTDLLDGSVARILKEETYIGVVLDPIADKILIIPIAVYILFDSHAWLFWIVVLLEVASGLLSLFNRGNNEIIKSNIFGKVKMVLQSVALAGILIFWSSNPNMIFVYILWLSVLFSAASVVLKILNINKYAEGAGAVA